MRYHFDKPEIYLSLYGERYICEHPVYNSCTLYRIEKRGLAVIQQRFDSETKSTWWSEVDPWICLIGASSTNLRRNAALATAYTLSESTLKEYQEKVVETIGEKKEQSIRDSVSKDKMVKNPVREVILTESGGNTICYDVLSGRYFKSDRDKITRVMNELNRQMRDEMYVTLNDFYYELGLDGTKMGDINIFRTMVQSSAQSIHRVEHWLRLFQMTF